MSKVRDTAPPHIRMMRERMEESFMSQADLAWILGKSPSDVSLILRGSRRLTPQAAVSYGVALNLPASELLRAQNLALLALSPSDGSKAEAIRGRVALVEARKRKDAQGELAHLRRMRDRLDARIAELERAEGAA